MLAPARFTLQVGEELNLGESGIFHEGDRRALTVRCIGNIRPDLDGARLIARSRPVLLGVVKQIVPVAVCFIAATWPGFRDCRFLTFSRSRFPRRSVDGNVVS